MFTDCHLIYRFYLFLKSKITTVKYKQYSTDLHLMSKMIIMCQIVMNLLIRLN